MDFFKPHILNTLKTVEEQRKYIQRYFYHCDNGIIYYLRNLDIEEVSIERLRTIFFRTVKDRTLIEWYLNESDDLYNYAELDEILDIGRGQKNDKNHMNLVKKKKKHVEKKIQDVVIKTKSKKEKKVKDVFDEVLLKTEEETDEDGEKPVKYNEKETGEMLEKAFEKF